MREPNTMYAPHRMVTPHNGGVTFAEIEAEVINKFTFNTGSIRPYALLFAILKVGCSIPKLLEFTGYEHDFIRANVEHLRERGHLFTGQLSTHWVLSQVPGSEDLIERITGQRIIKKEIPKMAISAEDKPVDEPMIPKRKYKKRSPKPPKGDGTLRIKKASSAVDHLSFSITYIDNDTRVELKGDSLAKLNGALDFIDKLREGDK